jgi:hypothetical protein
VELQYPSSSRINSPLSQDITFALYGSAALLTGICEPEDAILNCIRKDVLGSI